MKLRTQYEFSDAIVAFLGGVGSAAVAKLGKKVDTQAPNGTVTDREVTAFVAAAKKGTRRLSSVELLAVPVVVFLKQALNLKVPAERTIALPVEDMSKLQVPAQVPLVRIRGELELGTRDVVRGTSIGDLLEKDTPVDKLHAFAKSLSTDGTSLTLRSLLKARNAPNASVDVYDLCNALLERHFVGRSVTDPKSTTVYTSPHMTVTSAATRQLDVRGNQLDVNLRPGIKVTAQRGDIVIMHASLPGTEPVVARINDLGPLRPVSFGRWRDLAKPSTLTIVIARQMPDGLPPHTVETLKLNIPVNVARVTAPASLLTTRLRAASA